MPEVKGVGGGIQPQEQNQAAGKTVDANNRAGAQTSATNAPVGQPGTMGQPTGMPVPAAPGGAKLLPDVLAGRDASQMVAAERMREAGGASATDQLLGLNLRPSVLGALVAPPGNSEALRHISTTMRRTIMRGLLDKQRQRMRRLARLLRDDQQGGEGHTDDEQEGYASDLFEGFAQPDEAQVARAREELRSAAQMLDLLDEMLVMQDYAISQMGTFAQG
jgi:hypothetical protein